MTTFSLLIKPTSADCNLRCTYCFYLDRCQLYPITKQHRMSHAILEKMITSCMQTRQPIHSFGWQGGEPTLMGLEFFTHAVNLQNSCRKPTTQIANGLQTNGTLIDDNWAVFLKRYRFLVGVSLDGPQYVHNHFRTYGTGKGTYDSVLEGIKTLQWHTVDLNILTLVSQANISRALEVYQFLRDKLGCLYHQYIECVDFDVHGDLLPFSINGGQWGDFLCTIFDEWLRHDTIHSECSQGYSLT